MNGVSIARDRGALKTRRSSTTSFADFFAPLYPKLAAHSWLVDGALFSFKDSALHQFEMDVLARDGECRYFRFGSLERWTRYLVDDWCTVLGFLSEVADPQALVKTAAGKLTDTYVTAMTPRPDVAFQCIDAARWTFYAQDDALVRIVQQHASARGDLNVRMLRFGEDVA
jgi:hypothetical protein